MGGSSEVAMRAIATICVLAVAILLQGCGSPPKGALKAGSEREAVEDVLGDPIEQLEVSSLAVDVYSKHESRPYYRCYGPCGPANALTHLFQELLDPVFKTYVVTYDHDDRVLGVKRTFRRLF